MYPGYVYDAILFNVGYYQSGEITFHSLLEHGSDELTVEAARRILDFKMVSRVLLGLLKHTYENPDEPGSRTGKRLTDEECKEIPERPLFKEAVQNAIDRIDEESIKEVLKTAKETKVIYEKKENSIAKAKATRAINKAKKDLILAVKKMDPSLEELQDIWAMIQVEKVQSA